MEVLNLVEKMTSSNRQNLEGFLSGVQPSGGGGYGSMLPRGSFFRFQFPKVPFPEFLSHSDKIFTDCPNHFPDFNLESFVFY